MSSPLALDCRAVNARYGKIEVCHEISMKLAPGTITALLGPNGAGKSSFVGAIAGIVSGTGEIEVDGVRIDAMPAHRRSHHGVALVPEGRANIFPSMTVGDNLRIAGQLAPADSREPALELALDLFAVLKTRMNQRGGDLSGGEQQMLAIAMALAGRPSLILLDEPSQGLAPAVLKQLTESLRGLHELNLGVLLVEQNQVFAGEISDSFFAMVDGRITASGNQDELRREALSGTYLGMGSSI